MTAGLEDLRAHLSAFIDPLMLDKRKRANPKSRKQIDAERGARKKAEKLKNIAVLDMETDPFDKNRPLERIQPFTACIYSDNFEPIVIWNENLEGFCDDLLSAFESLPAEYTVFAHNGGKFDWMLLIHRLRGAVSFKGRAIMSAKIGRHTIRDSFHIIPEALAAYRKEKFDYTKLYKANRNKHRAEIIEYMVSDCKYTLEVVKAFVQEHGLKLSIGQAAMAAMKATGYEVENLGENSDAYLRHFYFGGRVECITGKGEYDGEYKLFDVNSMYPFVMADYLHPVSRAFEIRTGQPGPNTCFIELTCDNAGALVTRGPDMETSPLQGRHKFKTTIHEYNVAIKLGLISNVQIHYCIDFEELESFDRFVVPFYERRQHVKKLKKTHGLSKTSQEYIELHKEDTLLKLILNNAYGKFATNPRKYKESYITTYGFRPPTTGGGIDGDGAGEWNPDAWTGRQKWLAHALDMNTLEWGDLPAVSNPGAGYSVWEKPVERLRFRNVATAASITGAARAVLLEAIHSAVEPIYCDTDSLICRDLKGVDLDGSRLGAWDLEDTFERVIIAGKKMYACDRGAHLPDDERYKIRSKGTSEMTYAEMRQLIEDEAFKILKRNRSPTLMRSGKQVYIERTIRATAGKPNAALLNKIQSRAIA